MLWQQSQLWLLCYQPFKHLESLLRRHLQHQSSQEFSQLMLKMVRCETETEYEILWEEYNKTLSNEPFLP